VYFTAALERRCTQQGLLLQWQVRGDVDVDIGANPSAEGGDEDDGGGSTEQKVVDLIDAFRLNVKPPPPFPPWVSLPIAVNWVVSDVLCMNGSNVENSNRAMHIAELQDV